MSKKVMLTNVRTAFLNVFEAKQVNGEGEPRYGCTFLIEPGSDNDKKLRAAIDEVGKEKWGAKWTSIKAAIENNPNRFNFQNGAIKPDYDGFEGMWYVSANRKEKDGQPTVINRDKSEIRAADGVLYSGCRVNASIDIFAYLKPGNGISAGLAGIQFFKDDESFGAARASKDEFEEFEDQAEDDEFA